MALAPIIKSKYYGTCKKCHGKIRKGDEITLEDGQWVHAICDSVVHHRSVAQTLKAKSLEVSSIVDTEAFVNTDKPFTPSEYQKEIFEFVENGEGNGIVIATAGSGKTTTIKEALKYIPKEKKVLFVAYNRHIAHPLARWAREKGLDNVKVGTVHSIGLSIVKKLAGFKDIDEDKVSNIMEDVWPIARNGNQEIPITTRMINRKMRTQAREIVSLCKATLCDYKDVAELEKLVERFNIEVVPEQIAEVFSKIPYIMERSLSETETIDFDDMPWLPVVHSRLKLHTDKYDFVLVDEGQDLNRCYIEFIMNCVRPDGRILIVGDPNQSLYGFRGADTEAMARMKEILNAKELPLTITYRCPVSHVKLAQSIVPQIEASPDAKEGTIQTIEYNAFLKEVHEGDMVMCRTNGPLVKPAFELIRKGMKAVIRGKEIGKQLVNLIQRFETEDLGQLEIMLSEYTEKEVNRLLDKGKELQAAMVQDKTFTIMAISKECKTTSDLINKLLVLFDDQNSGVIFSSVHRAKGLEAERTFILHQELMPHPKATADWESTQELNVKFVAYTRSKQDLFFVKGEDE